MDIFVLDLLISCEKGKSLIEYINLFFLNEYKKNGEIILRHFQWNLNKLKFVLMFAINIEDKKTKISYIFKENIKSFYLLH